MEQVELTPIREQQSFIREMLSEGSGFTAFLSLSIATIGSGILLLPPVATYSGLIWTYVQLLICAVISYYSIKILVESKVESNKSSYQELAEISFGKRFRWFVNLEIFIGNGVGIIVYFINILSLIRTFLLSINPNPPQLINDYGDLIFLFSLATAIVLPMSLKDKLKQLRALWILSLFIILFICGVVIVESMLYQDLKNNSHYMVENRPLGVIKTFPGIIYSFLCHYNVLDIFGDLAHRDKKVMKKAFRASTIFASILYAVVILFGYMSFTNANFSIQMNPNKMILLDYNIGVDGSSRPYPNFIKICILLMAFVLTFKVPIFVKPSKEAIKDFIVLKRSNKFGQPANDEVDPIIHFFLVTATIYCCAAITYFIWEDGDITNVLNIIASSIFIIHSFLLPATFYFKLPENRQNPKYLNLSKGLFVFMALFGLLNTFMNIITLFNPPWLPEVDPIKLINFIVF